MNLDFKILGVKVKYLLTVSMCLGGFLILCMINEYLATGILLFCVTVYIVAGLFELVDDELGDKKNE